MIDWVLVVGGGKAAAGVTKYLESVLGSHLTDGLVITKHPVETTTVRTVVGDHPLPTKRNVCAATELIEIVDAADEETLVFSVVTGGASSLLTVPSGELTVGELRDITEQLLSAGASIQDINTVRKHLSNIKGGRLASSARPATVAGVVLSDVVGNDLSSIGSGPTVGDDSTFDDAVDVVEQYDIALPPTVREHLDQGVNGVVDETPSSGSSAFDRVMNHLICSNRDALTAARTTAHEHGYDPAILTSRIRGEAREVGTVVAALAEEVAAGAGIVSSPAVLLAGGECTVTVTDEPGKGGPNQEFVLSAGLGLQEEAVVAAIDTDGEDGSSEYAGAILESGAIEETERASAHLGSNDAGSYLEAAGATILTGPTGTNVNDIIVVVIPE